MTTKTTHDDLPLTDPKHPLHAGNRPAAEPSKPVATEVKTDAPAAPKAKSKREKRADAKARKAQTVEAKVSKQAKKPDVDPETGEPKNPRSVVPVRYKARYAAEGHNGTCGDRVGLALKSYTFKKDADGRDSIDMDLLASVAKDNGIDTSKYNGLNNGMVRMNISNKLRGLIRHGETVVIGKQKFKDAAKALDKSGAESKAA